MRLTAENDKAMCFRRYHLRRPACKTSFPCFTSRHSDDL